MAAKPPIGVVIPGYGHPQFLSEAIISACEQDTDREIHVVIIDDGCKFPETREAVAALLPVYEGRLHYIRQKNTRLPGARNAGIRFLLTLLPNLDAIYFLDADNRISPYSIESYRNILGDDPTVGWAYPDISFFGLTHGENGFDTRETAPDYSVLKHLIGNISEAGSMVRAEVFQRGVMYDESMIFGYEDWDFWLYALEAGFRGKRCADSGFLYRRRPESMLADSTRMGEELVSRMQRTHKKLYAPQHVMHLEHTEAPYFALYLTDADDSILLFSDPLNVAEKISFDAFKQRFHRWVNSPREYFFPACLMVMSTSVWECLQANSHLLRWYFWQVREHPFDKMYLSIIEQSTPNFATLKNNPDPKLGNNYEIFLTRTGAWQQEIMARTGDTQDTSFNVFEGFLGVPKATELQEATKVQLDTVTGALRDRLLPVPHYTQHQNKGYAGPATARIRGELVPEICALEGREPFPTCNQVDRTLIAVKYEALLDAVARDKLIALLYDLRHEQHEMMLLIEYETICDFHECHIACYQEFVNTLIPYKIGDKSGLYKMYLGRAISTELAFGTPEDTVLFARQCTRIIACGSVAALEAFGEARLHGTSGYVFLNKEFNVQESYTTAFGKLLAYEHAIVNIATDEEAYRTELIAEGFPPSKFVTKKNFYKDVLKIS